MTQSGHREPKCKQSFLAPLLLIVLNRIVDGSRSVKYVPNKECDIRITVISRSAALLLVVSMPQGMPMAVAAEGALPAGTLTSEIVYSYVGHLDQTDDEGRLLVWVATVTGDLTGKIKWWFEIPSPASDVTYMGGQLTFYAARWEFWADEELLLAGETAGKTEFLDGTDGVWDGHGIVTEAAGKYESLIGREVYETGPVIVGSDPPMSFSGAGLFVIY